MVKSPEHLKKRHNAYSARVAIPRRLWKRAGGKREFVQALGTSDLREANRRKWPVIAKFKRLIDAMGRENSHQHAALFVKAMEAQEALARLSGQYVVNPHTGEEIESDFALADDIREEAREVLEKHGPQTAARFYAIATGGATFLADLVEPWLSEVTGVKTSTIYHHRQGVRALLAWAGAGATAEEFEGRKGREKAGDYVSYLIGRYEPGNVSRHLYHLRTFWDWLASKGKAERGANPWNGHKVTSKSRPAAARSHRRRPWRDQELAALLKGLDAVPAVPSGNDLYRETMPDLTRLALLTGARIEELCEAKTTAVAKRDDGWWMRVERGKTANAVRDIPLHRFAVPIIKRRLHSADGFVFPNLISGGVDQRRSHHVSKWFGRFIRGKLGITDPALVFHSLRATFADMMEGEDVALSTVKLLMGHKRADLTYGTYSKGERVNLRKAIERLRYSDGVMKILGNSHPRGATAAHSTRRTAVKTRTR